MPSVPLERQSARRVALALSFGVGVAGLARAVGPGWASVLPPLVAVTLAFATTWVVPSLIGGVLIGGILVAWDAEQGAWSGVGHALGWGWETVADGTNQQILTFIVSVMLTMALIGASGALGSLGDRVRRWAKDRRSTQVSTVLLGVALFFDDYANSVVLGASMRPLADRNRVSRAKLAFLVDATAAPIAGIAVVSTWIGHEVGLFDQLTNSLLVGQDGYGIFFAALPFRFYCFLMLAFVLINALSGRDFGPMLAVEAAVAAGQTDPSAIDGAAESGEQDRFRGDLWVAGGPILVLLACVFGGMWWDGRPADAGLVSWELLSPWAWGTVIGQVDDSPAIFAVSGLVSLVVALVSTVVLVPSEKTRAVLTRGLASGVRLAMLPVSILVASWALKESCDALATGAFLARLVQGNLPEVAFPALVFGLAGVTAFATGTSWGTMSLLIPTAAPVAFALDGQTFGLLTIMTLAAVLDGAILGDHCSPISDTTIMSSSASQCDHLQHVRTQMPYALCVGGAAIVFGYLPVGAGLPAWVGFLAAVVLLGVLLLSLGRPPHLVAPVDKR